MLDDKRIEELKKIWSSCWPKFRQACPDCGTFNVSVGLQYDCTAMECSDCNKKGTVDKFDVKYNYMECIRTLREALTEMLEDVDAWG